MLIDQDLQLPREFSLLCCIRQNGLRGTVGQRPALNRPQGRHVLNHKQAQLITSTIEKLRLDFNLPSVNTKLSKLCRRTYMLADHVEAEIFQHLEIIDHGLFSRCCIDSIGPEALIESAEHEYELAVQ